MKKILYILLSALLAAPHGDDAYQRYIEKYSELAVSEMNRTGVPASVTMAQGLLESAAGQSTLAVKANNHFGIKCHSDWKGEKMYRDDDVMQECFRVYSAPEASFRDHSDFLRYRDRYKSLFELEPTDYKGWARGLKEAGYATDPNYASKLIHIIEKYKLSSLDRGIEVPEKPLELEKATEYKPAKGTKEIYRFPVSRTIYMINGVPCVYALEGDDYASIAANNGLFLWELLAFNDLSMTEPLQPGDIVFLKAKKNKAAPGVVKYIVGSDSETLRSISQRFGVKASALRRLNKRSEFYEPREGDTIQLRRR